MKMSLAFPQEALWLQTEFGSLEEDIHTHSQFNGETFIQVRYIVNLSLFIIYTLHAENNGTHKMSRFMTRWIEHLEETP